MRWVYLAESVLFQFYCPCHHVQHGHQRAINQSPHSSTWQLDPCYYKSKKTKPPVSFPKLNISYFKSVTVLKLELWVSLWEFSQSLLPRDQASELQERKEARENYEHRLSALTKACYPYSSPLTGSAYQLMCYFNTWAHYQSDVKGIKPNDIDPCLCTHLIYSFTGMWKNNITTTQSKALDDYKDFNDLKKR